MAKNKFQPVSFTTVDDFFEYITSQELLLVKALRHIIFESIPGISEKLSYNVPFYSLHKRICFIWPASIPWGKVKGNGVQLGFINGHLLGDTVGYLEENNRQYLRSRTFTQLSEEDVLIIKSLLHEAAAIDLAQAIEKAKLKKEK